MSCIVLILFRVKGKLRIIRVQNRYFRFSLSRGHSTDHRCKPCATMHRGRIYVNSRLKHFVTYCIGPRDDIYMCVYSAHLSPWRSPRIWLRALKGTRDWYSARNKPFLPPRSQITRGVNTRFPILNWTEYYGRARDAPNGTCTLQRASESRRQRQRERESISFFA